ncbi:MAG: T9SS type A sorting domain-containing protein [Acidaminococcaceae bacterium]
MFLIKIPKTKEMKNFVNYPKFIAIFIMACAFNLTHAQTTVSGIASYGKNGGEPLVGITLLLYDVENVLVATTQSNNAGYYEFVDLPQGEYSLTGSSDLPPGEINIIDALTVAEHIEGIKLLDGIALLAADVDGDSAITWADYDYILTDHLVYGYPFPVGDWVFEQIEFTIDQASGSSMVHDIGGVSTADVKKEKVDDLTKYAIHNAFISPSLDDCHFQTIILEISAMDSCEIAGFLIGFMIQTESYEVVEVSSFMPDFEYGMLNDRIVFSATTKGEKPRILQPGDALVQIKLKAKTQIEITENNSFVLTDNSHFVNGNYALFSPHISVSSHSISSRADNDALLSVYPNPVKSQLNIEYFLKEEAPVTLSLFSSDGRFYHTLVDQVQMAGSHSLVFNRNGLPQGMYILNLSIHGSTPSSVGRSLLFIPE